MTPIEDAAHQTVTFRYEKVVHGVFEEYQQSTCGILFVYYVRRVKTCFIVTPNNTSDAKIVLQKSIVYWRELLTSSSSSFLNVES